MVGSSEKVGTDTNILGKTKQKRKHALIQMVWERRRRRKSVVKKECADWPEFCHSCGTVPGIMWCRQTWRDNWSRLSRCQSYSPCPTHPQLNAATNNNNVNKVYHLAPQNTHPSPCFVCLVMLLVKVLLSVYAHFAVLGLVISNSKSAHLVWLPRDQLYRRYKMHEDSIKFWKSLWPWPWKLLPNLLTKYSSLGWWTVQFNLPPKDQQFSRYGRNNHIWLYEHSLWPWTWRQQTNLLAWHCDLEDSKQFFFPMTLWLMMLHHHTKLGYKMFSSSEDIIRTNIDILYLCCNLDLECSRKRTRKLYSPMDDERRHKHTSAFDTKSSSG